MNAPVVVPDASVLLKWNLESEEEEDREKALAIRSHWLSGRCRIVLPSLWLYEVGNVLGIQQPRLANTMMEIYVNYRFQEELPIGMCETIFGIMSRLKVSFYDACYHSVALLHEGTLVTADEQYYRKASALGHVKRLRDWDT